jgi:hypothetical protein
MSGGHIDGSLVRTVYHLAEQASRAWECNLAEVHVVTQDGVATVYGPGDRAVPVRLVGPTEPQRMTPAQQLSAAVVRLATHRDGGLPLALEAIERALLGVSILPHEAADREALRGCAQIVASLREDHGGRVG